MGGEHHVKVPEVPDWRIYRVEDVPQLVKLQKRLAAHGLKDPWLRNEVWRYENDAPFRTKLGYVVKRGFKYGLVAAVITTAIEVAFFPSHNNDKHSHH